MNRSSFRLARHVPLYVFLGAIFWLVAALLIRFAGPELFHLGNPWLYALFAACLPAGWLFIILCLAIGGLPRSDALIPVSIMCVTGLTLDGIAISSFTSLYGRSPEHVMLGAAWLLWGVGVLLLLALYVQLVREP
jgi:hypothetical protein